jgi:hypothetical protein
MGKNLDDDFNFVENLWKYFWKYFFISKIRSTLAV